MSKDTLAALVARVEATTGPDRELDARIYILTTGGSVADADYAASDPDVTCKPPPYTASLDAAVSLVPEGWRWSLDYTQRAPYRDCGCATLFAPGSGYCPADVSEVYAATPALALVAAALRARMESDA